MFPKNRRPLRRRRYRRALPSSSRLRSTASTPARRARARSFAIPAARANHTPARHARAATLRCPLAHRSAHCHPFPAPFTS